MATEEETDLSSGPQIAALNKLILRSIVDHAVVTLDADGMITSWNEGAERILGWSENEIVGKSADVFFTDSDTEANRPEIEMRQAIADGRAEDVRWHVRKDGERFWGSGLMMPLLKETDATGDAVQDPNKIDGFVKIFRDRTVELNAQRRLNNLQDRAALAMHRSGTVGLIDIDLTTNTIVADATCARLHGVNPELAEGGASLETFFDGIVVEDHGTVRMAIHTCSTHGMDLDIAYRVVSRGKRPIWVQSQGKLQRDEQDRPSRLTGIVVDITDQRETLRMQEARLEFADRVREMRDPVEIAGLASRVIGETLYATRAGHGYVEADGDTIDVRADWNAAGSMSLVGRHRYSDFGRFASALGNGDTVIVPDVVHDERIDSPETLQALGIGALVNMPLMSDGRLKAVLFVNDREARDWTQEEIVFLEGMFDRTYAAIDRVRSEVERDLLAGELAHRMKNILAISQIIVQQSLRKYPEMNDERNAIAARLRALGGAQDVLSRADTKNADILSVIETSLAPHLPHPSRLEARGPSLSLSSNQVLGLSLALHELATNAAKYGALSTDEGRIQIEWASDDGSFWLRWTEMNGPVVRPPEVTGFGSSILRRAIAGYFAGRSELVFAESGLRFEITGRL